MTDSAGPEPHRRGFVDVAEGQVHYRAAGEPGSASGLPDVSMFFKKGMERSMLRD